MRITSRVPFTDLSPAIQPSVSSPASPFALTPSYLIVNLAAASDDLLLDRLPAS